MKILLLSLILFPIIYVSFVFFYVFFPESSDDLPKYPNTWWGPGAENPKIDKTIKPFKITFSDEKIQDLKHRLNNTRDLTPPLEGAHWTYGISGTFLKNNVLNYWLNEYNFHDRIDHLNKYRQFHINIQGLNIHFIRAKPKYTEGKRILPLLLVHGWPGSVSEFYKIIPLLTTPQEEHDFVFEVIAPSLPGFGFSSAAVRPGLGSPQMAVVLKNLMLRLGYDQFYTQGGDWGAIITSIMASLFPEHVLGTHSNMCTVHSKKVALLKIIYSLYPSLLLPKEDEPLMYPLKDHFIGKLLESGYLHIQATKPDTLGVGLADSPAGLAAYVLEKFSTATNRAYREQDDGGLYEKFTPDVLLDNLMMYWIPNSMTTAMRIYAESFSSVNIHAASWSVKVPSACAQFPHEISWDPPEFLKEKFHNLLQVTRMPRGGHFAALEEPKLLADDVWKFISAADNFHKLEKYKKTEF